MSKVQRTTSWLAVWLSGLALACAPLEAMVAKPANVAAAPTMKLVEVEKGIRLEVLDWGGDGQPLIFLAGFGGTAHTVKGFAERFTSKHHVYSITRRGFGILSRPPATEDNYSPTRLAADIHVVIEALGLERPFLAGHSIAGQELSDFGLHYPNELAGLIYLEAANSQAFYGPRSNVVYPIAGEVRRDLDKLPGAQPSEARILVKKLQSELPRLQQSLAWYENAVRSAPDRTSEAQASAEMAIQAAMVKGARIYGPIGVPILSIVAVPPSCAAKCDSDASKARAKADADQADDFANGNPSATVVRLPHADHFIWRSNEHEVEQAMNAFMDKVVHH